MATRDRLPISLSALSRLPFPPGPLLLPDHCGEEISKITILSPDNGHSAQLLMDEMVLSDIHANVINAAVPRVSCCLMEASQALSEKNIEDLCARLAEASNILDEVLLVVCPDAGREIQVETTTFLAAEAEAAPDIDLAQTTGADISEVQLPRALQMAA